MNRFLPAFSRDAEAAIVQPVLQDFTPLEPRMLMDASLGWDLSGSGSFAEMVSGVHQLLEEQLAGLEGMLEQFTGMTQPALSLLDSFAPEGSGDSAAKIDEIAGLLRQAMEQLKLGSEEALRELAADTEGSARADALRDAMEAVFGSGTLSEDQLNRAFGFEALSGNLVGERVSELAAELIGAGRLQDQAQLEAQLLQTANAVLRGGDAYEIELRDIERDGETLIRFTEKAEGAGVEVEIALPGFGGGLQGLIDQVFDGLGEWVFGGVALPFDVELNDGTGAMRFDLVAGSRGADVATGPDLWLQVINFDFDPLLSFGGAVALPAELGVNLGLLSLTLDSLELAEFAFSLGLGAETDLGYSLTFSEAGLSFDRMNVDVRVDSALLIREVGAEDFVALEEDESYDLLALGLSGTLDFFGLISGPEGEGLPFGIAIGVNSMLLSSEDGRNASLATRIDRVLSEASLSFDVDLSGAVEHDELRDVLEDTISGLATMGMEQITGFLRDVGDSLSAMLRSSMLNVEIPFTDIELSDVLGEVAAVFSNIDDLFTLDPVKLGFTQGLNGKISGPVTEQAAEFDPAGLAGVLGLRFQVASGGTSVPVTVDVDLSGLAILQDPEAEAADQAAALAAAMSAALLAHGYAVTAQGTQLRIGTLGGQAPTTALALTGMRRTEAGYSAADFSLLGFGDETVILVDEVFGAGSKEVMALLLTGANSFTWTPGAAFAAEIAGMDRLIFSLERDGREVPLPVLRPEGGWAINGAANLPGLQEAFETAFARLNLPVEVTISGQGLVFSAEDGSEIDLNLGVSPDRLTRAFDLTSLISWVNDTLALSEHLEGASLELTSEGALIFKFPDVSLDASVDGHFSLADIGMADLKNLSLSARLSAALSAQFDVSVGIDVAGFARALMADSDDSANALEARRALDIATDGLQAIGTALIDNIFFADVALAAEISASATSIKGNAGLGIMDLSIGLDDPSLNFLQINTQFDFTLIGGGAVAGFSERVTLRNILDAFLYTDAAGESDVLRGLNQLIGRTDLQGGIVTDGAGTALDAEGGEVTLAENLQLVDADSYTPGEGEVLSQLYLQLGDVRLNVAGIEGLNQGIIDGIALTVDDLTRPLESLNYRLLGDGAEAIEALSTLGNGDILDSFSTILNLVSVTGEALKEKLPFLDKEIPLLNFSVLDAVDFAKELSEQIKDLRDNPQAGLNRLKSTLEGVFGHDTVTLEWDGDAKTLRFGLTFSFLKDFALSLPFNFDLDALIGDQLARIVGAEAAKILTNLADVEGDGNLVFDPDLTMSFQFGLDLSQVLADAPVADATTLIGDLSSVGAVVQSSEGANDLRVRWKDLTSGQSKAVNIDIDGAKTLGELVTRINSALQTSIGDHVSFTLDAETGQITLSDSNSVLIDTTDVEALFGGDFVLSGEKDGVQTLALILDTGTEERPATFPEAYKFHIAFGTDEDSLGAGVDIEIAAKEDRDAAGFVKAINEALAAADIARNEVSARSVGGWTIPASQLVRAELIDGVITLTGTNFAETIGADTLVFAVSGIDASHEVTFELLELGGSNAARLLGFDVAGKVFTGELVSEGLEESREMGAPRLFLDTENSGLRLSFTAGAADGLNLKLGFGPISIAVVDGTALVTGGKDTTDPAYLAITFNDIDGTEDGEYDLSDLFRVVTAPERSIADLFSLDVGIGIVVDLSFQDSLGFLKADQHGFSYKADLLVTDGPQTISRDLLSNFRGDLVNLWNGDDLEGEYELKLPEISEITSFLTDFNILAMLNNPAQVLNGLDMILGRMQDLFDQYLAGIDLPVVGNAIGSAVTFFTDFRLGILAQAREIANTPKEDGTLPTTVDLLTGWFNDKLNELFNKNGEKIQFIQAFLNTDGGMSDSYIYGAINFSAVIFDEMLDIGFELGLPGFELAVKEGSGVRIALDYSVNLGFGFNKNGFFLLNDTDAKEIRIGIRADAGSFQGSAKLLGILGISADAVTETDDGFTGIGTAEGTAVVSGELGVDLYGQQGLVIIGEDEVAKSGEIAADFSGISVKDGLGNDLAYERLVYISKLSSKDIVKFAFNADVDIQLGLTANILDPTKKGFNPLLIGGYQIIPSAKAELMIQGGFDSTSGLGMVFDRVAFENVRIDASVLYDAIIRPVVEPLMGFIEPLADALGWMQSMPFKLVVDALATAFPIFGIVNNVLTVVKDIADFVTTLHNSGGEFIFGTFDFTNSFKGDDEVGKLDTSSVQLDRGMQANFLSGDGEKPFGVFGSLTRGFALEIPLLSDPFSAINLLLGKFDQVDLVKVHFTLLNLDLPRTSMVDMAIKMMGLPGFIGKILSIGLQFEIGAKAYAGISVGYDLSGIVNFVNTNDPLRLLDGIFMETKPFIDVAFELAIALNLGIVGLTVGGGAGLQLGFNDPNDDGKMRITELIAIIKASVADPGNMLGYIFEGKFDVKFFLDVWVKINLGIININIDIPVVDLEKSFPFGGLPLPTGPAPKVEKPGGTATLGVGSNIGASLTDMDKDGDDVVSFGSPAMARMMAAAAAAPGIQVNLGNEQGAISGTLDGTIGGLIIPAGKGNNTIDMSGFSMDIPVVIYADEGNDTITLPDQGFVVVFLGDGRNVVTAGPEATGTYVIFGGSGRDEIDVPSGNVVVFGEGDHGLRDLFVNKFSKEDLTLEAVTALLGLTADGRVDTSGAAQESYHMTTALGEAVRVTLADFLTDYTRSTQLKAGTTADVITAGNGNAIVLGGGGNDVIRAGVGGSGEVRVYAGAGHDQVTVGGLNAYVEGGAGADVILSEATGSAELWGWGKQGGESGQLDAGDDEVAAKINQLSMRDGADILIGGAGNDRIYGQLGNDVIEGGLGNDLLSGGLGTDLMTGGRFDITSVRNGTVIQLTDYDRNTGFNQAVNLAVRDMADGSDTLSGGNGDDILLGGGGDDRLEGGRGADVLIGDFAKVRLSSNLVAESVETIFDGSAMAGNDYLDGGAGNDILIGGGRNETIRDTEGDNIVLGDFGVVNGTRLNEGITSFETRTDAMGGNDTITTGAGRDLIIGGIGDDSITSGDGDDAVIGDDGVIYLLGDTDGTVTAILTGTATSSGNDVIVLGSGNNRAIGGLGDDSISFADGHNVIIGDTGEISETEATGTWLAEDGNDTVTGGHGRNRVVLGGGADVATLGNGGNRVIGDGGWLSWTGLSAFEGDRMESRTINEGGNDRITTGSGDDVIMGGHGNETITGGLGNDILLGDNGVYIAPLDGAAGSITGAVGEAGGHDVIYGNDGNDILIGGQGNDTLHAGSGEDLVLGDSGTATFIGATDLVSLQLTDLERGGHDVIRIDAGDLSDDILIGQAGNDTISAGSGDDVILGENALFTFLHPSERLAGQSAADRMIRLESVKMQGQEGDDDISGGVGNDIVIAGFGADNIRGDAGQDILIGDAAIITRRWEANDRGGLTEWLTIDTNFAFDLGGYDTIRGGDGADIMIGNLGPDLFYGDTASDAIFSDGYAGLFRAWLPSGFTGRAENDQRYLFTSNFAGQGAVDVVSNSQQNAAIGDPLDGRNAEAGRSGRVVMLTSASVASVEADLWRQVVDRLDDEEIIRGLAQLIAMGADPGLMAESMMSTLIEGGLLSAGTDPVVLEILLERLAEVLQKHVEVADMRGEQLPLAAE